MNNTLTKEDVKNSIEVQWRKSQIKASLVVWLIIACVSLFISFIFSLYNSEDISGAWLMAIAFWGLVFGSVSIFNLSKIKYIIKNHTSFTIHETCLDKFSISYMNRGAIYYTIKIVEDGRTINVDTNPYFSNDLITNFKPEDYHGKNVVGLYDKTTHKFYIIKRVD